MSADVVSPPSRSRPTLVGALVLLALSAAASCGPLPRALDLPTPIEVTTLGVGDVFELRIVGEEKLPFSFTVAPDGTVDLPYIKRVLVAGAEPQELAEIIRKKLVEREVPRRPERVREHEGVQLQADRDHRRGHQARLAPLVPGMTLVRAISIAGGFTSMARKGEVTVRRRVKGGTRAARVSVDAIIDNRIPDPMLQAGDADLRAATDLLRRPFRANRVGSALVALELPVALAVWMSP